MPVAVSDSSCVMHLAAIGRLELIREFFVTVTIPPAVWREVVEDSEGRAGACEVRQARSDGWVNVVPPANEGLTRQLLRRLGAGEAETIALAVELQANPVLLDETRARAVADSFGLRKVGAVGILIRARLEGRVESLRQELERLRIDSGFWIADDLFHRSLEAVGEA